MFENIIITGGSSQFVGIEKRMEKDNENLVKNEYKVKASIHKKRSFSAWVEASIRGVTATLKDFSQERRSEVYSC